MNNIKNNILHIDGVSTVKLAEEFGTPLYVYSLDTIKEKLREIKTNFLDKYPNTHAAYACKAFCTVYICKLMKDEGFWLDVVSGGEIYTALKAGFPMDKVEFNGNNKSDEEILLALQNGVRRIVVDNPSELYHLEQICENQGIVAQILFRVTPNVKTDTHAYISTAMKDSKFGIPLEDELLYPLIEHSINSPWLDFLGFHFHVGSQLLDASSHHAALEVVLDLINQTKKRFSFDVKDFNLGGGFGVKYTDGDKPLSISEFIDPMMERLDSFCLENNIVRPRVSMEPGRYIVAEAGTQLYTIGNIKEIKDVKTYVSVDGGMTDNLRPGLYGASYNAIIANKADEPKSLKVDISGKCCESTDILIKNIDLPTPKRGDILAVFTTGAYGFSMASNYNLMPIPAVVIIENSIPKLMVRRETYEDLISKEIF